MLQIRRIILILVIPFLLAFHKPVKITRITSSFGESRGDHFHNGIDFGGGEMDVYAFEEGEIVFYWQRNEHPFKNYLGYGNSIFIKHSRDSTDNGFITGYLHLKDGSIPSDIEKVSAGAQIGITGNTGRSSGIHLHFQIMALNPLRMINPILYFNDIRDGYKPRITGLFYEYTDSPGIYSLKDFKRLNSDREINFYVKTHDVKNSGLKTGVYKIKFEINGELFSTIKFEHLIIKDNKFKIPPDYRFEDIYKDYHFYKLGSTTFSSGRFLINVRVSDFSGNTTRYLNHIIARKMLTITTNNTNN